MAELKVKDMNLSELIAECKKKGIPYQGAGAEQLRKKLGVKR